LSDAPQPLPSIERRTGVKFEYVPVLLGGIFINRLIARAQ
jgi:hypothetical protein